MARCSTLLRNIPARSLLLAIMALWLTTVSALAQDITDAPATLIADRVEIQQGDVLVASGGVEILVDGTRITAGSVRYDGSTDLLTLTGPIRITSADGSILLADSAQLDQGFRNAILRSARLVLNQQLQLAAAEIHRVDGRYTQLYKTVASSCHVCNGRAPLWQIRAKRIIHDELERQLYFDNATFELAGVPIFFLPRLRLPDPTLERATGFLAPSIRSTDALGFGIKIPYFIAIGDHKDLTLTPYVSTNNSRTLELRYRQAFRTGRIELNGAVSEDDIRPGEQRSYLFAEGQFDLPRDFKLSFDVETVSDTGYLLDYDYSGKDRLDSALEITRTRRDEFISAGVIAYRSLRSSESNQTQPTIISDFVWDKRYRLGTFGSYGFKFEAHDHYRRSTATTDGMDDDSTVDGRDLTRLALQLNWQQNWVIGPGLLVDAQARLTFDQTDVRQDDAFSKVVTRTTPQAALTLRWPLAKRTARATQILEPIVQLAWASDSHPDVPIEESTQVELDEGNLFSLSRFAGGDQFERGLRAHVGVSWTRIDARGWEMGVTLGRILRAEDLGDFAGYPGLEGKDSDWLAAVQLKLPGNLLVTNRALFDDGFRFSKNELRVDWRRSNLDLAASYIWMERSPFEDRPDDVSELTLDGRWQIDDTWAASLDWRYDFELDRAASAELGIQYRNECIKLDLSVSRRFTSSDNIDPSTDFGLNVGLIGFGAGGGEARPRKSRCTKLSREARR